jgi:hypothetical protein
MNSNEFAMTHPHDHIMANTWRLIIERKSRPAAASQSSPCVDDLCLLEQLLPEYRLIGLCLADNSRKRRLN